MVVPLGPGKFYGSSLPRPRIYNDVKLNPERIDPPVPVTDALMSWANEAHWCMGGLSFKRLHLQGRIEGNVDRLRRQKEKEMKSRVNASPPKFEGETKRGKKRAGSESPPPAPKATKRRKLVDLFDEESEGEKEELVVRGRKKMVRKLVGDFERVAREKVNDVVMKVVEEVNRESEEGKMKLKGSGGGETGYAVALGKRTSPRLANHRST